MFRRVDLCRRDQAVKIEGELIVQIFLHGAAKNSRQDEAADHQTKHAPYRRGGNQPERQRIRSGDGAVQLSSPPALGSSSL